VNVRGLTNVEERLQVYQRVRLYRSNPLRFIHDWQPLTSEARQDIIKAQDLLIETEVSDDALHMGLQLVHDLEIDSHRAEYALFEAARAYAASDGRSLATVDDLRAVAPMALRQRRSDFMTRFFEQSHQEDQEIEHRIDSYGK
jgi:magnesium chelatase subunit I